MMARKRLRCTGLLTAGLYLLSFCPSAAPALRFSRADGSAAQKSADEERAADEAASLALARELQEEEWRTQGFGGLTSAFLLPPAEAQGAPAAGGGGDGRAAAAPGDPRKRKAGGESGEALFPPAEPARGRKKQFGKGRAGDLFSENLIPISGDGNCLFRAVSRAIYGAPRAGTDDAYHVGIRQLAGVLMALLPGSIVFAKGFHDRKRKQKLAHLEGFSNAVGPGTDA